MSATATTGPADACRPGGGKPLVSVVIACVNGLPAIAECLRALENQEGDVAAEVIVADRCGEATRAAVQREFPGVQLVAAAPRTSIPALRALGMARARGCMVAVLEDHCNVDRRWLSIIARAWREGHRVVGGAVVNGSTERTLDWAVFFCEYARFMPPVPRGVVGEIAGNNSVYDRALLEQLGGELPANEWESFLHKRLRELGVPLYSEPDLVASHKKEFGFLYFLSQRYHYSRSFAAMRLVRAPWWRRAAYACATPALPPLLFGRILRSALGKGGYSRPFLRAAPAIGVFLLSWAWGEAVGALLGPGDSLERVE